MDQNKGLEDKLREAACFGDEEAVHKLIEMGVNVNSQHEINGWTALHWASKRGHGKIVSCLLSKGADKYMLTKKGETASMLTDNEEVAKQFGNINEAPTVINNVIKEEKLPIIPNYITFPPLQYKVEVDGKESSRAVNSNSNSSSSRSQMNSHVPPNPRVSSHSETDELVLKVRVAGGLDPDFIEVEVPSSELTYLRLLRLCCQELGVEAVHVLKLRKLPDTMLRKDKDVQRLREYQELELVLSKTDTPCTSPDQATRYSISPFPPQNLNRSHNINHCKIFY